MFPLYALLEELVKAEHEEVWICTSDDSESYRKAPMFPGSWLNPKIVTRDGRVIAERVAKPNDWSLCGDWRNVNVRPSCAAPYMAIPLSGQLRAIKEKAILQEILSCGISAQ